MLAARKADWAGVEAEIKTVKWQTDELKTDLSIDMEAPLRAAVKKKESRAVIVVWANLVALANYLESLQK